MGKNSKCSKKDAYRRAIYRIIQQIRGTNIPGSTSQRSTILSMRNFGLSISLADSTIIKYSKLYGAFQWLLMIQDIPKSSPFALECFASYLSINKKSYDINTLKPAIQFFADVEGWQLNIAGSFARVKKGLTKAYYMVDRKKLTRNGISAYDIKSYIDSISSKDEFTYNLSTAIMVVGFRLLARPGDICSLSWSSLKQDVPKKNWLTFDLSGHKTDYFMIDDPTPIEPYNGDKKYCPSFILKRYIRMVSHLKSANSSLFGYNGSIKYSKHISGHSLRIGAATELGSRD